MNEPILYRPNEVNGYEEDEIAQLVEDGALVLVKPPDDIPDARLMWVWWEHDGDGMPSATVRMRMRDV